MYTTILRKLKSKGPVHAWLEEEEYRYLRRHFHHLWVENVPRRWDEEDRLVALGFLRAYTLHREIPEDENHFWKALLRELGSDQDYPTPVQFDALWSAFAQHPETKPYLVVVNERRMLVQTINFIWGVKGLMAKHLEVLLERYINARDAGEDYAIEQWLSEVAELAMLKHHAPTYGRIFEGIYLALNAVSENPKLAQAYLQNDDLDALLNALAANGLFFGRPHPLIYLSKKSEFLLKKLLRQAVGHSPHKKHRASVARPNVEVRFLSVEGLSELQGVKVIPNSRSTTLFFAGRRVKGEVRLASGLRKGFFWRPHLDEDGNPAWVPPEEKEVLIRFGEDEVRIRFELKPHDVIGISLPEAEEALDWHQHTALNPTLHGGDPKRLRYRLQGDGEVKERMAELWPRSDDVLYFEYLVEKDERTLLGELPVRYIPKIDEWEVDRSQERVRVYIKAALPADGSLQISLVTNTTRKEKVVPAHPEGTYQVDLPLHPLEQATLMLQLNPGGPIEQRLLPPKLNWANAVRKGVGVGRFPDHLALDEGGQQV